MAVSQAMPANLSLPHAPRVAPAAWSVHERLHDFVKCALLQQLVPPGATICDLYCGRGMDTEKWARAQIGRYVGVDIASSALEEAREQWDSHNRPYAADFCEVDPCMADLQSELRHMGLPADFVCCMGHLQDSFFNEEMVKRLLLNVASVLKPGGYFFGTTADSSTIWSKYQKAVEGAHKSGSLRANGALPRVNSEHYAISFEDDRFTSFGTKYTLQFADAVISHNHVLVHFPSLIRLAEDVGLEFIEIQNLQEFYEDYRVQFFDTLRATCGSLLDPRGRLMLFASDVLSLYTTFIFKKADPSEPGFTLSPLPLADEDQLEPFSHEATDLNITSQQEHYISSEELTVAARWSMIQSSFQNDVDEADGSRLEDDHRSSQELNTVQSPALWNVQGENEMHVDGPPLNGGLEKSKLLTASEDGTKNEGTEMTKLSDSRDLEAVLRHSRPGEQWFSSCSSKLSFEHGNEEGEVDGQFAAELYSNWSKPGMMEEGDLKRSDTNRRLKLESGGLKGLSENPQQHLPDEIQHHDLDSVGARPLGNLDQMDAVSQEAHYSVRGPNKILLGCDKQDKENVVHCSVVDEINHGVQAVPEVAGSMNLEGGEDVIKGFRTAKPLRKGNKASIIVNPGERELKEQSEQLSEACCSMEEPASKRSSPGVGEQSLGGVTKHVCHLENVLVPPLDSMSVVDHQVEQHTNIDSGGKVLVSCQSGELTDPKDVHAKEKLSSTCETAMVTGETELDRHLSKSSTGRTHTRSKEPPRRDSQEPSSGLCRYSGSELSSKSYHHASHGERREQSQKSRYSTSLSHTSYHSRTSKDEGRDNRSRNVFTNRKVEDSRDWSRGAYTTQSNIRLFHISHKELAFYPSSVQSPNTRGILGPCPPSLAPSEPIRDFHSWHISKPPERAVRPKARSSRSLSIDQKKSGSPGWSKSPDRNSRDSPPPGTES